MTYALIQREHRPNGNVTTITLADNFDAESAWQFMQSFAAHREAKQPGMYGPYGTHRLVLVGAK